MASAPPTFSNTQNTYPQPTSWWRTSYRRQRQRVRQSTDRASIPDRYQRWIGAPPTSPLATSVNAPNFSNFDALTTSMDWNINSKDSIRGRYIYNTQGAEDTAANLPVFFTTQPFKYHLVALSEYHTFTPNLTNEFRLGYNRYSNTLGSGNFTFPGLDQFPNLQFYDQGFISIGPDGNAPQFTIQNLYQATDNVSWVKGKHTFKFGFDGRKFISPQGFTQRARGDYEWAQLDQFLHDLAPDRTGSLSVRPVSKPTTATRRRFTATATTPGARPRPSPSTSASVMSSPPFQLASAHSSSTSQPRCPASSASTRPSPLHQLCPSLRYQLGSRREDIRPRWLRHGVRRSLRQPRNPLLPAAVLVHQQRQRSRPASLQLSELPEERRSASRHGFGHHQLPQHARRSCAAACGYLGASAGPGSALRGDLHPHGAAHYRLRLHG